MESGCAGGDVGSLESGCAGGDVGSFLLWSLGVREVTWVLSCYGVWVCGR